MTSFRFHTNFTNPLKITIILPYQQSPTTPNCCSSPDTGEQAFSRRCLSATVTDVVVLEPKRAKASPNCCCSSGFQPGPGQLVPRGKQAGFTPSPSPGEEQSTHRGKLTEYPTSSGQNHWETTCQDHCFSAATPSHAGEVFKFAFSKFAIQTSDCKEQPTML